MTAVTFDAGRITPAARPAGAITAATTVAARSVRKFVRTPQLLVISTITGAMFLLIFRYVFGGAIETGPVEYVTFMVPGYIVTSVLFTGSNASSSVAQDLEEGFTDRLRSLPVSRTAVLAGRVVAESALLALGLAATLAIGFVVGFRPQGTGVEAIAAFGLVLTFFAFMWLFVSAWWPERPGGAGHVAADLPAVVRVERHGAGRLDARLAAADRREPAHHRHDQRGPVPGPGRPGAGGPVRHDRPLRDGLTGVGRRAGGGVRPAGGRSLPQGVTARRRLGGFGPRPRLRGLPSCRSPSPARGRGSGSGRSWR